MQSEPRCVVRSLVRRRGRLLPAFLVLALHFGLGPDRSVRAAGHAVPAGLHRPPVAPPGSIPASPATSSS